MEPTRHRITSAALRLFGERGFAGTSIAQIEAAAGLSPGSGGLYKHFRSKEQLLISAVTEQLENRGDWGRFLDESFSATEFVAGLREQLSAEDALLAFAQAGLARLDHDRDVTRILMREAAVHGDVLAVFRDKELRVVVDAIGNALRDLAGPGGPDRDWDAMAAVLTGAVANYWQLRDIFGGEHPLKIDSERYLRSLVQLVAATVDAGRTDSPAPPAKEDPR